MKHLIQTIILCLVSSFVFAQSKTSVWVKLDDTQQKSAQNLKQDKSLLSLQANDDLRPISTETDPIGMTHHRYQQTYKGVPIEGAIFVMHEKNGLVKSINGQLANDLDMNVNPIVNEQFALQTAMASMNATLFAWDDPVHENMKQEVENNPTATFYPEGELVIVPAKFGGNTSDFNLAYKFDIYAVTPHTRQHVYVDARTGNIVASMEQIHDCTDVTMTAEAVYSGPASYTGCSDGTLKNSKGGGMQVFDAMNMESFFQAPTDLNDPAAVEVHWATEQFYDYLLTTFNRTSLDSSDMRLYSWVHYGDALNNAFWNGLWMTYGDGDGVTFNALTAPDVVAHEMTHGLTDFTSNLVYESESGALNESFSDIFGEVLENYISGTNDWIIGADFTVQNGKDGLRNMSNPNDPRALTQQPDTYGGSYWVAPSANCTQFNDYCGVHFNSGVQNFWFYLLTEGGIGVNDIGENYDVSGIGMANAATIAYYNLTYYLTPNSTFADAREGSILAAEERFGEDSNEVNQVKAAWCAVGVGTGCIAPEPGCRYRDSLALVEIYNALDGPNWVFPLDLTQPMNNWSSDGSRGIFLNEEGCVMQINLWGYGLSGTIPPEIGDFSELEFLDISMNQLGGTLPDEIGNLTNLTYLGLSDNNFTGCFPTSYQNLCANLNVTDATWNIDSGNNFDATWEDFCSSGAGMCNAYNSSCRERDSIALVALYNATDGDNWGTYVHSQANTDPEADPDSLAWGGSWDLSQPMNTWFGVTLNEFGCVTHIDMGGPAPNYPGNKLQGPLPPEIGNLSELERLVLYNNRISGSIPPEIENLSKLEHLNLCVNWLSNVPPEIGNLSSLIHLDLTHNGSIGNIPAEIGNLINLQQLIIPVCGLSDLPHEIINLTNLTLIDLHGNQLTNIPIELASLPNLQTLKLYDNNFGDCFPSYASLLCGINVSIDSVNNSTTSWLDFCAISAGICTTPVLPGDTNNDGIANINDFLIWGLNYGKTGPVRLNAITDWVEQEAPNWSSSVNGINSKHADADGNGIIDELDKDILDTNYGFSSNPLPDEYEPSPVMFSLVPSQTEENTYELRLQGNETGSVHGVVATLDTSVISIQSINFPEADIQSRQSGIWDDIFIKGEGNKLHIGMTKTDGIDLIIDGPIAIIIIENDIQTNGPICILEGGNLISSLGEVTPVMGSFQQNISSSLNAPASLIINPAQCGIDGTAMIQLDDAVTCDCTWSNGDTGTSTSNLPIGSHSVSLSNCSNGYSGSFDFYVEWAYTPVEMVTIVGNVCFQFNDAPLTDSVQVSFGDGVSHPPITINTCYPLSNGTYDVTIWNINTNCPVDMGQITVGDCNSAARFKDAKTGQIAGRFTQFAGNEFIKNFLQAEKTYIRHRREIHRILESKEARYQSVNKNFDIIKEMALDALFQSFVRGNSLQISEEHLQAIDKLLLSLNAATRKSALQNEITKVRQHLHVMQGKELKDALIAFDRAGGLDESSFTTIPADENNDILEVQLLNTLGRESRMTYQTYQSGSHQIELYNINGQYIRTLQNSHINAGQHELIINKDDLTGGIYFIRIKFISESGLTSDKVLKLPVMN